MNEVKHTFFPTNTYVATNAGQQKIRRKLSQKYPIRDKMSQCVSFNRSWDTENTLPVFASRYPPNAFVNSPNLIAFFRAIVFCVFHHRFAIFAFRSKVIVNFLFFSTAQMDLRLKSWCFSSDKFVGGLRIHSHCERKR